jgi:hypothetical protein
MPRQPFQKIVHQHVPGNIDISSRALGKRPELEALIARCVMAWPTVEIEMAMILGHLIGAKDAATLAVFQHLRRSSAQREAIMEAANIVLNDADRELLTAFLNVHRSIEAERNALCHGHFGVSDQVPDGLLWMSTRDYVPTKSHFSLTPDSAKPPISDILSKIYVYRSADLVQIFEDIKWLGNYWFDLLEYFRLPKESAKERGKQYHQLCDRPHVARELKTLREKPQIHHQG